MGLLWAKGEAGASLLATCDSEKSGEAFHFAPNKEGGVEGVGGWQAGAGADGGAAPGNEQLLAMLALCDMFRLFGPARAESDGDEVERWGGALEVKGERGLQLWAELAQHAIDRKVKAVWWLSHYGLLESKSSCKTRMPSVWYEPAADMSRSGGGGVCWVRGRAWWGWMRRELFACCNDCWFVCASRKCVRARTRERTTERESEWVS